MSKKSVTLSVTPSVTRLSLSKDPREGVDLFAIYQNSQFNLKDSFGITEIRYDELAGNSRVSCMQKCNRKHCKKNIATILQMTRRLYGVKEPFQRPP